MEMAPVLDATANRGVSKLAGQKWRSGMADGYGLVSTRVLRHY
jgi:hypothetical protein